MVKAKTYIENLPLPKSEKCEKQWRLELDKTGYIYDIPNFIVSTIKNMDFSKISEYPKYGNLLINYPNIIR